MAKLGVKVPGFSSTALPATPIDQWTPSSGMLLLVEPGHPGTPWKAGVPATGTQVPNLAATQAAAALGGSATEANAVITVSDNTGSAVALSRTPRGALHGAPSKTAGVSGNVFQLSMTNSLAQFLTTNKSHYIFIGVSMRVTAPGGAGSPSDIVRIAQSNTAVWAAIQEGSSGTSTFGWPTTNATSKSTPGLGAFTVTAQGSAMTSILQWFLSIGARTSAQVNKSPAVIPYVIHVEDLSISGRTHAQANAAFQAKHNAIHGPGGRYYGDTWNTP